MAKPKTTMPDELKSKCAAVIHTATTAAAAAGVIPIPGVGTVVGGVISAGTSIALTETLGWIVADDFYKKSLDPNAESILDTADTVINGFGDFAGTVNSSARTSTASVKPKKKRFGVL